MKHAGLLTTSVSDWHPLPGVSPLPGCWPDSEHVSAEFVRIRNASIISGPLMRLRGIAATQDMFLRALRDSYAAVPAGGTVWLHFSLHGSHVPDQDGDEADGWDECLCLAPGRYTTLREYWKRGQGVMVDDDFGAALSSDHLTVIVADYCMARTGTRAANSEGIFHRGTPYGGEGTALKCSAPVATMRSALARAPAPVVFLAACQPDQTAADLRVDCSRCQTSPPDIPAPMLGRHGALTYALWSVWQQEGDWSMLRFRELWERVQAWPRWASLKQEPSIDYLGGDPDGRVFGGLG